MTFADLDIDERLLKALAAMGLTQPTEIQAATIPLIKAGKDIVGQSKTGSGKTIAFCVPILEKLRLNGGLQALIVTPTRELAEQIGREIGKLTAYHPVRRAVVYGGVGMEPQVDALKVAEIAVGTPGRLLDHLERGSIKLSSVRFLVLDEADRMLDMGFIDDVDRIIRATPKERQTLLFGATLRGKLVDIANERMRNPEHVVVSTQVEESYLAQCYYQVDKRDKFSLLVALLKRDTPPLAMVFCATRGIADDVAANLEQQGLPALVIHGGLTQARRNQVMELFHTKKLKVLVATDVAGRGLDIKDVTHVYNYNVPKEPQDYIHRIGRTARAGASGEAVTLLSQEDFDVFRRTITRFGLNVEQGTGFEYPRLPYRRFIGRGEFHLEGRGGGRPPRRGGHGRGGPRGFGRGPPRGGSRFSGRGGGRSGGFGRGPPRGRPERAHDGPREGYDDSRSGGRGHGGPQHSSSGQRSHEGQRGSSQHGREPREGREAGRPHFSHGGKHEFTRKRGRR